MQRLPIFLTFAVLLASIIASAQTIIPGGPVSGLWTQSGSPYLIEGEITLPSNNTLTIDPGVDVIFQGTYKFIVRGILQAIGTETDSITFTTFYTYIGWRGLRFYNLNSQPDSSRLVYCVLEYGWTRGEGDDKNGGVLFATSSDKLSITHCSFRQNHTGDIISTTGGCSAYSGHGGAIYLNFSDVLIANCTFHENRTGNAVGAEGNRGQNAIGSTPATMGGPGGAGVSGSGGTIYSINSSPAIVSNQFLSNFTGSAEGGTGGYGGCDFTPDPQIAGDGGVGGTGVSGNGGALCFCNSPAFLMNNLFIEHGTGSATGGDGGHGGDG
ncbi:MAG: hypothetical protein ABIE92_07825, partial [bacterium]